MSWDVLLYWMSYLGEGSWTGFRDAVARLAPEADQDAASRSLRVRLSDLGYVSFFVGGSQRWRVEPPVLAGMSGSPHAAILCGARTRQLVNGVEAEAARLQCGFRIHPVDDGPSDVFVEGSEAALVEISAKVGIPYIPDFSLDVLRNADPIPRLYAQACESPAPIGWRASSFDFKSMRWVGELLPQAAWEFSSRYGVRRHFVADERLNLRAMGRREAVYASAWLQGVEVVTYDLQPRELSTPAEAPMPELYARAACLSSGQPAQFAGGRLVYSMVPPAVAYPLVLMTGERVRRRSVG